MKRIYTLLCFTLIALGLSAQGTTTSSMTGVLVDESGETLIGAVIEAVHTPSGTKYATVTDIDGGYRISNMRVGGPYTITGSYVGFEDQSIEGIFLSLGEKFVLNLEMKETSIELGQVDVVASRFSAGQNAGAGTNIDNRSIETMPTLNRDLNDFTRMTPQSAATGDGGFSVAGVNNKYNAVYFDGAVANDVFGLADNGTNGGQTGIAPISIDAIDQIQVLVSPYDVSLGGFAGGGINAVTKSGDNTFRGSAYFFTQNEDLVGKTNGTLIDRVGGKLEDRRKVAEFQNNLYGLTVGGPIVKDKVFFFVNAEIEERETPLPFEFGDYDGNARIGQLDTLRDFLIENYDYDPGDFGAKTDALDGIRFLARLDFNLSDQHKLSVRHNYVNAEQTDLRGSGNRSINFANNGIFFPSVTNTTTVELNSTFGSTMSNNLILGYTNVRDDRDFIGNPFPAVNINDGRGRISFGSEPFSTANQLDQDVFTLTNNFKLYKGRHTLTFGTHNEFLSVDNLFIGQNFGDYDYASLDDFLNNASARFYERTFSRIDEGLGDDSDARAVFNAMQLGFYVQDEFQVNKRLSFSAGLRLDIPVLLDDPEGDVASFDPDGLIADNYDLQGAIPGQAPSSQLMWSPRVGFNYDVSGDRSTVLRGGVGVFTSRIPFAWPGGMYINDGLTLNNIREDPRDEGGNAPEDFIADPSGQPAPNPDGPSGQLNLFAEDFKYPQVVRTSFAVDKAIGSGWNASVEAIYTKTINNVRWQNVNSNPEVDFNWNNGFDDRPVYADGLLDSSYNDIYLASNTDEGYTFTLTGQISKRFSNGLSFMTAYTFNEAEALFEGTSSQNSSQWRGAAQTDGRNVAELGRSDFSFGHRVIASLDYELPWTADKKVSTGFSLFYNGQAGTPYSYVYGGSNANNINNETGSVSRERSLIYVPKDFNDINLVDIEGGLTAEEQWENLDDFIENDRYLSGRRGRYAEKNGARDPWSHQVDLRITQNIGRNIGGDDHQLQLTVDIFNVLNLIHRDWGTQYSNTSFYEVLNFVGYDPVDEGEVPDTPQFTFDDDREGLDRFGISDLASRWRSRIGVRYIFN